MHFTFNHSYDGVFFNVECEYIPNILFKKQEPHIEWVVDGFKDVREIVVSTRVHESKLQEEIYNLTCEIEDLCIKVGQRAEREMLEDCLVDNYLRNNLYI